MSKILVVVIGQGSLTVSETARTPLSDTCRAKEALDAKNIFDLRPTHQDPIGSDERGVASDVDCDRVSLNVAIDIVGEMLRHPGIGPIGAPGLARINPLGDEFESCNSSPDVGRDIGSRIEKLR